MKFNRKKALITMTLTALLLSALYSAIAPNFASAKKGSDEEAIYVSFFWIGSNENDCLFKDTLITHSTDACLQEYARVENMIKNLAQGKNLAWGVIMKCGTFKTHDEYNDAVNKYTDKCVGE